MAQPIVIEVVLTAKNQTGAGIKEASKLLDNLTEYAEKAEDALNSLIEKAKKEFDSIDCSKAKKELEGLETSGKRVKRELKDLARDRYEILLEVKDKVSPVLSDIKGGIKGIAGKTWNVTLKAVDDITRPAQGILNLLSFIQGALLNGAGAVGDFAGLEDISNTLQNTLMGQWGIGLWEGLKPGLEKISDWLDENQDTVDEWADRLEEMGAALSSSFIGQIEKAQRAIQELLEDPVWRNADFFDKIEIAWDRLIADPLTEWWNTAGKERVSGIAEEFGDFLGSGLNHGIRALLGVDDTGVAGIGVSIGKSFLGGFLEGFNAGEIGKAIQEALSGIYKDSLFGGGNSKTAGLSTAFIGMLGLKGISAGIELGEKLQSIAATAELLSKFLGLTGTAAATGAAGTAAAGTAAGGGGIAAGLSVPAIASVFGAVLSFLGLKSSLEDLSNSRKTLLSKDREVLESQGLAKGGMVAAGAAIGTLIAPGMGTLIGGGIGGFAALSSENILSELFKSESEKALESLDGLGKGLEDAVKEYNETASQVELAQGLLDEYKELKDYMNSDDFDSTKAEEAQDRMKQILEDINEMFPGLISGYEMLNGLSEVRVGSLEREMDLVEEQSEFQMEQAKRELESGVLDVKTQMPKIREDYQEINEKLLGKQAEWEANHEYYSEMAKIYVQYESVDPESEEAKGFLKDATELSKKYEGEDYVNYAVGTGSALLPLDVKALQEKDQELNEDINELGQDKAEKEKQLEGYYKESVLLAEMDTGIDLDAEQQKLETLQAAYNNLKSTGTIDDGLKEDVEEILPGFEAASNAGEQMELLSSGILGVKNEVQPLLEKIDELNKELDLLPENKKINIRLDFSGPTPSEITFFKWNMNPLVGDGSPSVEKNAFGGFISRPELSWIGEDGPEAIIPLSGKYRRRGLELYEQAGRYLGVSYNGDGGVYGSVQGGQTAAWQEGGAGTVTVPVTLSPQAVIQINQGSTTDEVKGAVWQSLVEMLDPLAMQIANIVMRSQENSPGGGV